MSNDIMTVDQRISDLAEKIRKTGDEIRTLFQKHEDLLVEYTIMKQAPKAYIALQEQRILDDIKSGKVVLCNPVTRQELKLVGITGTN